jgi:hypothetical protein
MADLGSAVRYGLGRSWLATFDYRFARFNAAISDECSFYALLISSSRLDELKVNKTIAFNALQFKTWCLQVMGERLRISGSTEVDDGTMFGALDLSEDAVGLTLPPTIKIYLLVSVKKWGYNDLSTSLAWSAGNGHCEQRSLQYSS